MKPSPDIELEHAEIRDGHPLKPGGVKFEDLRPMTVRQMKERFPGLDYNAAHFVTPPLHQWMANLGDGRFFYGSISDDKVHPELWNK